MPKALIRAEATQDSVTQYSTVRKTQQNPTDSGQQALAALDDT